MSHEPVIEELHRHREELFAEFGNDPEALLRYLQQKEAESGRVVKAPEPPQPSNLLPAPRAAHR